MSSSVAGRAGERALVRRREGNMKVLGLWLGASLLTLACCGAADAQTNQAQRPVVVPATRPSAPGADLGVAQ